MLVVVYAVQNGYGRHRHAAQACSGENASHLLGTFHNLLHPQLAKPDLHLPAIDEIILRMTESSADLAPALLDFTLLSWMSIPTRRISAIFY